MGILGKLLLNTGCVFDTLFVQNLQLDVTCSTYLAQSELWRLLPYSEGTAQFLGFVCIKELFRKENRFPVLCSSSSAEGKRDELGFVQTEQKCVWQAESLKGLIE